MMRVHNSAVAEDLVQETLLAALVGARDFAGRSSERTWLIGILKHKIVDYLRKSARETPLDTGLDADPGWAAKFDGGGHWIMPPRHWHDPGFIAENEDLRQVLMACIERLPEKLRQLFVLREIDGLDTDELTGLLQISRANLWTMLSRGRERVRACLDRTWFGQT